MYTLMIFGLLGFHCAEKEAAKQNSESAAQKDKVVEKKDEAVEKAIGTLSLMEVDEKATLQKENIQKALDGLKASGTMSNKDMLNGKKVSEYLSAKHPELLPEGSTFRWKYKRVRNTEESPTAQRESFILKNKASELEMKNAIIAWGADGTSYIAIELTQKSGKVFAQITKDNVGKRLAIMHDEMVLTAPAIRSVINGGRIAIDVGGKVPDESVKENKWLLQKLMPNK